MTSRYVGVSARRNWFRSVGLGACLRLSTWSPIVLTGCSVYGPQLFEAQSGVLAHDAGIDAWEGTSEAAGEPTADGSADVEPSGSGGDAEPDARGASIAPREAQADAASEGDAASIDVPPPACSKESRTAATIEFVNHYSRRTLAIVWIDYDCMQRDMGTVAAHMNATAAPAAAREARRS